MGSLYVEGGHQLSGSVVVSGAKNSALKLMAASLLAQGRTVLTNVPRIADVFTMIDVLRHVGASVDFVGDVMEIDVPGQLRVRAHDNVRSAHKDHCPERGIGGAGVVFGA